MSDLDTQSVNQDKLLNAMASQKYFSYMGGLLFEVVVYVFVFGVFGIIFQLPLHILVTSFVFSLLSFVLAKKRFKI